jgi:hypothetical protein
VKKEIDHASRYEDGRYGIRVKGSDWMSWSWASQRCLRPYFTLEVDAELDTGAGEEGQCGLVWGYDNDNFYAFCVTMDGRYRLGKKVNGDWQEEPVPLTARFVVHRGGETNRLRVAVDDAAVELSVNGVVLKSLHDAAIEPKRIGVAAGTFDTPRVHARFDNFRFQSLEKE